MRSSSSSAMSSDGACVEQTGKAPAKLELGFASASRSRCLSTPLRPSVERPRDANCALSSWTFRAGGLEGRCRFFFSPVAGRGRFREGGDGGTEVESGGFGLGGGASTHSSATPDSAAASRRKAARQRSNLNNSSGGHSSTRLNTSLPMDWPAAYFFEMRILSHLSSAARKARNVVPSRQPGTRPALKSSMSNSASATSVVDHLPRRIGWTTFLGGGGSANVSSDVDLETGLGTRLSPLTL
mmetsp:Transcript_27392/g.70914  ORF Transcript_27392/g.70914 Transcript_27392/m.70914 type:complete len:241 (+) Transcript_27392:219-941(+)